ncbi:hypothetical protein RHM66_01935 [Pseudomonas sp. RTB3]|nr:hypothetical protein RHM66_01935 [Pseudomonas sp. RTB3]
MPDAAAAAPAAVARLDGPVEVVKPGKVRDLAQIRSSRTLRVLVNQSRNSSGEVQGEAIGGEYHRLHAFEQYLNGHSRDGQEINAARSFPRPRTNCSARWPVAKAIWWHPANCWT